MNQLIRNTDKNRYPSLFDRFFDEFWRDFSRWDHPTLEPRHKSFRTTEKDGEYLVSFDLPGVKKEDVHVEIDNGVMTIRAERKDFWANESGRGETYNKFERSFTLPTSVDVEKVQAQMEDGVLNIVLPKLTTSKGRKVEISSSGNGFWKKLTGNKSS